MKRRKVINKKVRNAQLSTYYGITFKSKLELYCYKKLKENKINFKYEEVTFELMPGFKFNNNSYELYKKEGKKLFGLQRNTVRAITYTPDFVGDDWIIETKGNPNDTFPLKWKLFKKYIVDNNLKYELYMPRNQKQINETIELIKSKNEGLLQSKKNK